MSLKLITPAAVDPVTLAEVKAFLRLATNSFSADLGEVQSLAPAVRAAGTYNGLSTDVLAVSKAVGMLEVGVVNLGATATFKLQDSNDNLAFTDVTGATVAVTAAGTVLLAYTGSAQYLRMAVTVVGGDIALSGTIIKDANSSPDDPVVRQIIKAATAMAETYTGQVFIDRTFDWVEDSFPVGRFLGVLAGRGPAPKSMNPSVHPLKSVSAVYYTPINGTELTWDSANYLVIGGRLALKGNASWPTSLEWTGAVRIRCVLGYGTAADVPADIKAAILLTCKRMYDQRDAKEMPEMALELLAPYCIRRF